MKNFLITLFAALFLSSAAIATPLHPEHTPKIALYLEDEGIDVSEVDYIDEIYVDAVVNGYIADSASMRDAFGAMFDTDFEASDRVISNDINAETGWYAVTNAKGNEVFQLDGANFTVKYRPLLADGDAYKIVVHGYDVHTGTYLGVKHYSDIDFPAYSVVGG